MSTMSESPEAQTATEMNETERHLDTLVRRLALNNILSTTELLVRDNLHTAEAIQNAVTNTVAASME